MNYAEQIAAFEARRDTSKAALEAIAKSAADEGATLDAEQKEQKDNLLSEIKEIDDHLKFLRDMETISKAKAVPAEGSSSEVASVSRAGSRIEVKTQPKLAPGVEFARLAKVKAIARLDNERPLDIAERMYGENSNVFGHIKAAVVAGSTASGNWAANLVGDETGAYADFVSYLRPATVLGRFGTGNIPSLRMVPFREPLITQTGGGAAYWVGEGKPKPLTSFGFSRTTLEPLKIANIAVLTQENIRSSNPSSEMIVRDALRDAIAAGIDTAFIDPTNAGTANVKPASVTNGTQVIAASTYTDADDIRTDVRSVWAYFIAADNPPENGVWVMSPSNALALSMITNGLGQREFPDITMTGGVFEGLPVIVSRYAGTYVALVNASDIYFGDEGGIAVDMSTEASLEMLDASLQQDATAGTGASLVSLWQSNLVGLRAERELNWARRRTTSVVYLSGVAWGGAVNSS